MAYIDHWIITDPVTKRIFNAPYMSYDAAKAALTEEQHLGNLKGWIIEFIRGTRQV